MFMVLFFISFSSFSARFAHYLLHVNIVGIAVSIFSFLPATSYGETEINTVHIKISAVNVSATSSFYVSLNYF